MSVFMVTWNLNKECGNYDQARRAFLQHLERYPHIKDSGLESVRWISSGATAGQISDDLQQKMDANDRVFITKLRNGEHGGWLDSDVCNWIAEKL